MFGAPQPRSRLYTTMRAYTTALTGALASSAAETPAIRSMEQDLERIFSGFHAIAVPMARVGIYLTLRHTIRPGQKVVLSSYTISDVVNMVLCAGGVPLFVDIEPGGSFNIDADAVTALLRSEENIGAVLATHFYGLACDITRIAEACKRHGVALIEDAAQGFGTKVDGRWAGTFGDAGVFSFGLLKNVTGFTGGAIITRDDRLAERLRKELGEFPPASAPIQKIAKGAVFDFATAPAVFDTSVYWLFRYAYLHSLDFFSNKLDTDSNPKSYAQLPRHYARRMPGSSATIVSEQLAGFQTDTEARIRNATLYFEGLHGLSGIVLPPHRTDGSHIYLYYPIQHHDRDRLVREMTRDGRDIQISHHRNCASMPCFAEFARDCPNAEAAGNSTLYLPTYPGYRSLEIAANIEIIRRVVSESRS